MMETWKIKKNKNPSILPFESNFYKIGMKIIKKKKTDFSRIQKIFDLFIYGIKKKRALECFLVESSRV